MGMEETRHERYRRLAANRQTRLLKEIQILGNLSNRKNYAYTAQDVADLFTPLREELNRVQALFDNPDNS